MAQEPLPAEFGAPNPLMVELLFDRPPALDLSAVADLVAARTGTPTAVIGDDGRGSAISFPEITITHDDTTVPYAVWFMTADNLVRPDGWLAGVLEHSWTWKDAGPVVEACEFGLLAVDLMSGGLDRRLRLPLYHAVLGAVVEATLPRATHWMKAARFVQPEAYLEDLAGDPTGLQTAVNIRYVLVADRPGEQVMDTLGMSTFGLPDLQAHFTTLEPSFVAGRLFSIARYLFENGDVIEDGHTVPGLTEEERWPCAHEVSMMAPRRAVLDIDVRPHGPARP